MQQSLPVDTHPDAWSIFTTSLKRIPWKDFLQGLFVPIVLVQIFGMFGESLLGVGISLAWLCIIIAIRLVSIRSVSIFAIISLLMLITQTGGECWRRSIVSSF